MSRKPLLLLIAVFVGLSAVGLWLTRNPPPLRPAEDGEGPPPAPVEREARVARLLLPDAGASAAPAPSPTPPPAPPRGPDAPPAPAPLQAEKVALESAVRAGEDQPRGMVDKEAIRSAIRAVTPLIKQCFTDAADRYPPPQKVVLKFTVIGQGISGHFDDGEVLESTIADPWVQSCFLESLVDARFPAPSGGGEVTVTYPFKFEEARPDAGVR